MRALGARGHLGDGPWTGARAKHELFRGGEGGVCCVCLDRPLYCIYAQLKIRDRRFFCWGTPTAPIETIMFSLEVLFLFHFHVATAVFVVFCPCWCVFVFSLKTNGGWMGVGAAFVSGPRLCSRYFHGSWGFADITGRVDSDESVFEISPGSDPTRER